MEIKVCERNGNFRHDMWIVTENGKAQLSGDDLHSLLIS